MYIMCILFIVCIMCVYVCMYVCIYIHITCVCVYIYIYISRAGTRPTCAHTLGTPTTQGRTCSTTQSCDNSYARLARKLGALSSILAVTGATGRDASGQADRPTRM